MSPTPSAAAGPGTDFTCGLCGETFTHGGQVCGACPISKGCDLVKCPGCGYQFPRTSRLVDALARLWAGGRKARHYWNRWRRTA
jgi:hypothetical protein